MLNPVAPHITEELWTTVLGHTSTITYEKWPEYDETKTIDNEIEIPVQINGKVKATITIPLNAEESEVKEIVNNNETVRTAIAEKNILKEIYVKNKIYNIVVK